MRKLILLCLLGLKVTTATAWSLKTHLYIAQLVLNDVVDDGMVNLDNTNYAVPQNIWNALKNHPDKFRMGSLGPDVFPDFIVGQMTTHPGIPNGWQTDEWLKHILDNAGTEEELAFAYGYVVHASCDIFAHTYVNMYAGDIFSVVEKETTVEARHFMLEKFIEGFTPALSDHKGQPVSMQNLIASPTSFLAGTLIMNDSAFRQHKKVIASAGHLYSMYNIRTRVADAVYFINRLDSTAEKLKSKCRRITSRILRAYPLFRLNRNRSNERREELFYNNKDAVEFKEVELSATEKLENIYHSATPEMKVAWTEYNQTEAAVAEAEVIHRKAGRLRNIINNWLARMDNAAILYVKASDSVAVNMLAGSAGSTFAPYSNWAACHSWSFTVLPDVIPQTFCEVRDEIKKLQDELKELPNVKELNEAMEKLKGYIFNKVKPHLFKSTKFIVANLLKQDDGIVELAYYMKWPGEITAGKLDTLFAKDASTKKLMKYSQVSQFVLRDMQVGPSGMFNPILFGPVANSITLSKLALLDPAGLNKLIANKAPGYRSTLYGSPVYTASKGNFTILLGAVKSIDGNHQWQAFPLPYPREAETKKQEYSFGYNYFDKPRKKNGFKIWVDPYLRQKVFLKLFNKTCLGSLANELKARNYPFPECDDNPFPSAVDSRGKRISQEIMCP